MACLLSKGRTLPCKEFLSGLYKLWFVNYDTIIPIVDANNVITDLSGATAYPTLYEYELKGVSKFTQQIVSSRENGTTIVNQTLTLDLQGGDYAFNNELKLLAYGRPHVFVQDNFGSVWFAGKLRGLDLTDGTHDTGGAMTEKYGYTLTLVGVENEYANFVSGSTITAPFGTITNTHYTIVKGSN